ncbi:MAG: L-serine ammonia-lyase, iron-sulfur-dependent, subunit alpha [Vampirovibrio sp.]|nr:L-serine ammonia-lyase, iron-sulfur-dependent, subunit alpha [Vampirovibrio sp.]
MKPFDSFDALLAHCEKENCTISQAAFAVEKAQSGREQSEIEANLDALMAQMRQTIESGIASDEKSMSGLSGGDAKKIMAFLNMDQCFLPPVTMRMIAYGLATLEENSRMKKIVACPTAGGSGSVPALLIALEHEHKTNPDKSKFGLATAGIIGQIVAQRMHLSGAAAGCQAEVGVASGMAAAAAVETLGGAPQQVLEAAAISMQNLMGLVCDPVAGLVEVPCVVRNGISGVQAGVAATMAMAGVNSFIPLDEVVDAMAEVGRMMNPRLKESAEGGLAQTPTAVEFTNKFFK